jgi:hypothetical protein
MISRLARHFFAGTGWISTLVPLLCLALAVPAMGGEKDPCPPVRFFLTAGDSGQTLALYVGDTVTVTLEYDGDKFWNLDTSVPDTSVLAEIEGTRGLSSYITHEGTVIIVIGDTWHFEAVAPGATTIRAEYVSSVDGAVIDVFEVGVQVFPAEDGSDDPKDPDEGQKPAKPFALVPLLDEMDDAIVGQRCVFPVTVVDEGSGLGAGDPVALSATLLGAPYGATISVEPNVIRPGEVAELTIIPLEPNDMDPDHPVLPDGERPDGPIVGPVDPEQGREVFVELLAERAGVRRSRMIEVTVLPGEDLVAETAAFYRDLFIPWLAKNHPELGITEETEWVGTIVKPHVLVVTYYLFFSPEWEMGIRWHVMIPPHDWAEIYLRRRGELNSTRAWRIHSVDGGVEPDVTKLPVEGVFR